MIASLYPPGFEISAEDTSCAAPLGEVEYSHLVSRLDSVVMPALWEAMLRLHAFDFRPMRFARHAGQASLVVQREEPVANAWLYFQIHRSYGPLNSGECVFWMYAIHHPAGTTAGRPGRLLHLDDPAMVESIVTDFVDACEHAPTQRNVRELVNNYACDPIEGIGAMGDVPPVSSSRRAKGAFASV